MNITNEMETNQTLGQFSEEADFFDMSKEYFDLLKESSEIELMERYCECQEYLMENADLPNETKSGLITEAADDGGNLADTLEKKKSGLWGKIKAGVTKVINAIVTLFSRLVNFWKNGKELTKLREEAKTIEKISEDRMDATAKHISELLRGKAHAINNLKDAGAKKDAEIAQLKIVSAKQESEIARVHAMFKGVNADLYKELKQVETAIAEEIVVNMPENVAEIDNYTKEVSSVIESYKVIRGKVGGNKNLHVKHARNIAALLTKLKSSRNKVVRQVINPAWIEEVYQSLSANKEKIVAGLNDISSSFNSAHDTTDNTGTSKNAAVHGVRVSADANFMELQRNLVGLLNEWIFLANSSIKTMKDLIDTRSSNLRLEAQILAEIKRGA